MELAVMVTRQGRATIVRCEGDLDLASAPELRAALSDVVASLEPVVAGGPAVVVIDLAGVPFLDCTAVGVLVRACEECTDQGRTFVLCGATGIVRRLLTVLDLEHRFEVVPTVVDAVGVALPSDSGPGGGASSVRFVARPSQVAPGPPPAGPQAAVTPAAVTPAAATRAGVAPASVTPVDAGPAGAAVAAWPEPVLARDDDPRRWS